MLDAGTHLTVSRALLHTQQKRVTRTNARLLATVDRFCFDFNALYTSPTLCPVVGERARSGLNVRFMWKIRAKTTTNPPYRVSLLGMLKPYILKQTNVRVFPFLQSVRVASG